MAVNYENVLYPEEAVLEYQSNLLDIYMEDYGEEHRDIIEERLRNTLYLFDVDPVETVVKLYEHARGDAKLAKRMTDEACNFSRLESKAIRKFRKPYINLLSSTFNVRRGAKKLLELDYSFLLDETLSEEDKTIFDAEYRRTCKRLGISPIYNIETIKALNSTMEMLNKNCDLYILENSLWGKRITAKVREKFGLLPTSEILSILKSATYPNLATTTQILSNTDDNIGSILYFPLVSLLEIGDIDHNFFHELRHAIETGDKGCGLKQMHGGPYRLIDEVHTEENAVNDLRRLQGMVLWAQDEAKLKNSYQGLFHYVLYFFEENRDLLNYLALYNNTELFENIFGVSDLLQLEFFMEELLEKIMKDEDFYNFGEVFRGKRLIKKLEDNAYSYFRSVD